MLMLSSQLSFWWAIFHILALFYFNHLKVHSSTSETMFQILELGKPRLLSSFPTNYDQKKLARAGFELQALEMTRAPLVTMLPYMTTKP